jgi:hypothetical protein
MVRRSQQIQLASYLPLAFNKWHVGWDQPPSHLGKGLVRCWACWLIDLGAFHLSYEVVTQPKVTGCVWNGEF